MKHFLTGAAIVAGISIINMIIHIVCNRNGIDLNSTGMGTISAVCGIFIYDRLMEKEKNKENKE